MQFTSGDLSHRNHGSQNSPVSTCGRTCLIDPLHRSSGPFGCCPFTGAKVTLKTARFDHSPLNFRIGFAVWEEVGNTQVYGNVPFFWDVNLICSLKVVLLGDVSDF